MTPLALAISFAAVLGLCLGSFVSVVAHRLPAGLSVVSPGSACPGCGAAIRPSDNIPILSWLALRGHCRACDAGISPRYPVTEAATGALFAAVVVDKGTTRDVPLDLVFVAALVAITLIDLEHLIIPDRITGPLAAVAVILTAALTPHLLLGRLIAGAVAGGGLALVVLAHPRGMGMGDAKLVGAMGLVLGPAVAPALLVAFLSGTLGGLVVMARKGVAAGRRTQVPFGPFLALGGIVGVFAGVPLVHAYLTGVGL